MLAKFNVTLPPTIPPEHIFVILLDVGTLMNQ